MQHPSTYPWKKILPHNHHYGEKTHQLSPFRYRSPLTPAIPSLHFVFHVCAKLDRDLKVIADHCLLRLRGFSSPPQQCLALPHRPANFQFCMFTPLPRIGLSIWSPAWSISLLPSHSLPFYQMVDPQVPRETLLSLVCSRAAFSCFHGKKQY